VQKKKRKRNKNDWEKNEIKIKTKKNLRTKIALEGTGIHIRTVARRHSRAGVLGMTLNCIHIFIVTGSFLYWCVMKPASQRFCIHRCILIISYLTTFLGINSLSMLMCRKTVNQSTREPLNTEGASGYFRFCLRPIQTAAWSPDAVTWTGQWDPACPRLVIDSLNATEWKTLHDWLVHATVWRTVSDLSAPRHGVGNVFWLVRSTPGLGISTPRFGWVVMTRSAFHS